MGGYIRGRADRSAFPADACPPYRDGATPNRLLLGRRSSPPPDHQSRDSGWTRVERFATTIANSSITEATHAIRIDRTTLIEQLHRPEADVGHTLFHRATADGKPHRPTKRGKALRQTLGRPDISPLRSTRARLRRLPV